MIRHQFEIILGVELRFLAIRTRARLSLTQKEMGERLHMSESSYSDIETGKSRCGALTAVLLLNMQESPEDSLKVIEAKLIGCLSGEALTV